MTIRTVADILAAQKITIRDAVKAALLSSLHSPRTTMTDGAKQVSEVLAFTSDEQKALSDAIYNTWRAMPSIDRDAMIQECGGWNGAR